MALLDGTGAARRGSVQSFRPEAGPRASTEAVAAYRSDGVVCLRGALDPDWLAVIEDGIDRFLAERAESDGADNVVVQLEGDDGHFRYATMMWKTLEPFRRVIFDSHAPDLFGSLLETKTLHLYYDFLLIKEPGCRSAVTPWHQDQSYYCVEGPKIANCWTALDAIPEETTLRFVMGSHLPGTVYRAIHFDPAQEYPGTLRDRPLPPAFDDDPDVTILSTSLEPGDALVWNSRTFHSAPGNSLDRRRAALSLNFAGDRTTYLDMPQQPDPPFRGEGLLHGGPITCESFPLLRAG